MGLKLNLFTITLSLITVISGQWVRTLNDFSGQNNYDTSNLEKWVGPQADIVDSKVTLTDDFNHKWIQMLSKDDKCSNISNLGLLVSYSIQHTSHLTIEYHQKSQDCLSYNGEATTAQVMFYQSLSQILVPLSTLFQGADFSLGYALIFRGPVILHRLKFISDGEAYLHTYPTSTLKFFDAPFRPPSWPLNVQLGYGNGHQIKIAMDNECLDISDKFIRITYSSEFEGSRTIVGHFRTFLCNNLISYSMPVIVMFPAGKNQNVIIPGVAFYSANLRTAYKISIYGPLTLHNLQVIDGPGYTPEGTIRILPPHIRPSSGRKYDILADVLIGKPLVLFNANDRNYAPLYITSKSTQPDWTRERVPHHAENIQLDTHENTLIVQFKSPSDTIDVFGIAFRLIYSVPEDISLRVVLTGKDPETMVLRQKITAINFMKGSVKEIVIPLTALGGSEFDLFLTVQGPITIHRIELVTTLQQSDVGINSAYPTVVLTRQNLFLDAYHQISLWRSAYLRNQFLVKFYGEEGRDGGGLRREFFTLISNEISNNQHHLFTSGTNYGLNINPDSGRNPDHLNMFRFIGRILGMAYVHKCLIRTHFSPYVFRMLFEPRVRAKDLKLVEPVIYESLKQMVNDGTVDQAGLTMSGSYPMFNGDYSFEFFRGGSKVPVTSSNIYIFMSMYTKWRLYHLIEPQIMALRLGVHDVLSEDQHGQLNWQTFALAITGKPTIDVDDWEAHTKYERFDKRKDITVKLFWQLMRQWTDEERSELLGFVTGSTGVPANGFCSLVGGQFTLYKDDNLKRLPKAQSCSNWLSLPAYTDILVMQRQLKFAIQNRQFVNE